MPEIKKIPISRIIITGDNPRQEFKNEDLLQLGTSIKTHGLLQPIIVRPKGNRFELIVGERRLRASELIGLTEIEARIEELDDATSKELRLIENTHREDLTDAEKGDAVYALWESYPEKYPTIKSVAESINTPVGTVRHWCNQSQKLSPKVKEYSARNTITDYDARYLVKYPHAVQDRLVEIIAKTNLTGRQTLELTKLYDVNPKADLNDLVNEVRGIKKVEIVVEKLSEKAREEVERVLENKRKEVIETRKKAMKKAVRSPRRTRPEIARQIQHPSATVLSKAERLKDKLEELEPTEREKVAKNIGERIDYLTRRVELERDVAEDKEMKELVEQWRASVSSKIRKESLGSFVKNIEDLLQEILERIGADSPDSVKEVSRKGLSRILSMNQLEELDKKLESTILELRDFQETIKSELFVRQSKIK